MTAAPTVDVVNATFIEGPRRGSIALMDLSCGHSMWRRTKHPARRVQCITCWLELQFGPKEDDMNFGEAIVALKSGQRVARDGWSGRWLCYMPPVKILIGDVNQRTKEHLSELALAVVDRHGLNVEGYIVMWSGRAVWQIGWVASQADMLAEDWLVVTS